MKTKVVVLVSGGMDSVSALYEAHRTCQVVGALSFDYGSKHNHKEIPFAAWHSQQLGIPHRTIKLDFVGQLFKSDLLQSGGTIPDGHYQEQTMKQTVVPFRNGIMLSIAGGFAESIEAQGLVIAAHAGDHAIYPDCREGFMKAMGDAIRLGTYAHIEILRPFIQSTKAEIARRGHELGIDYSKTWSCYKGGASHCFESRGRAAFDVGTIATKGRICVVSLSALNEPGLASLFFKVIKADFFRAVHKRGGREGRVSGIIADELPLLATADDVEALATIRCRRCFFAAASQGLAVLDERLGTRVRKAMMGNFGTVIFLRNREEETDLFAAVHLGAVERTVNLPLVPPPEAGDLQLLPLPRLKFRTSKLICPPGTLGRLAPHQGFVAMPDQPPHEFPLSFVPWFETSATHSTARLVDPASSEHLRQLMCQQGYELRTDPGALKAALEFCSQETDRAQLLEATTTFFRGRATMIPRNLDTLPTPWLKGLPGILRSQRKDHWTLLPYMISEMASTDGVLQIRFAQEAARRADGPITGYDQVRIAVNAALYPSLWRPLTRRHYHLIRPRRPSLGNSPNLPLE